MKGKRALSLLSIFLCFTVLSPPVWAANESDPSLEYVREAWSIHQQLQQQLHDTSPISGDRITASHQLSSFIGRHVSTKDVTVPQDAISHRDHSKQVNDLLTSIVSYKTDGVSGENKYSVNYLTGIATFTSATDKVTVSNAKRNRQACQKARDIAAAIAAQSSDPRQQVRLVNSYLGRTITYTDTGTTAHSPAGALLDGKAVCEGYAYAFHLIMDELGIPVVNVYGTSRDQDHMWNKVLIDGQWLYCDITWNDSTAGAPTETYLLLDEQNFYSKSSHRVSRDSMEEAAVQLLYRNDLEPEARALSSKGLFQGDSSGFRLEDSLTRGEMAVILTGAAGAREQVDANPAQYGSLCTFTDVPDWAKPYVGYCLSTGLVSGTGGNRYSPEKQASKLDFCTVILRSQGVTQGYTYQTADAKAAELGYISRIRTALPDLTRGDVVHVLTNIR